MIPLKDILDAQGESQDTLDLIKEGETVRQHMSKIFGPRSQEAAGARRVCSMKAGIPSGPPTAPWIGLSISGSSSPTRNKTRTKS